MLFGRTKLNLEGYLVSTGLLADFSRSSASFDDLLDLESIEDSLLTFVRQAIFFPASFSCIWGVM